MTLYLGLYASLILYRYYTGGTDPKLLYLAQRNPCFSISLLKVTLLNTDT